jgi:uncharacterized membrane protein YhaH (DUF805 family)
MGPAQAIRTGLVKSFQFSGRASRSEFWWFAPVGLAPPVLVVVLGSSFAGGVESATLILLGVAAASVPLSAAAFRRLHDVDKSGLLLLSGIGSAMFTSVGILFTLMGLFGLVTIIYAFPGMILIGVGLMVLSSNAIAGSGLLDMLTGLAAPSTPSTNRHGPPPSEVTP